MIQSMTGYGKATATFGDKKINVEIKSLNSKALDLSTRIAPLYREKEMEIHRSGAGCAAGKCNLCRPDLDDFCKLPQGLQVCKPAQPVPRSNYSLRLPEEKP